VFRYHSWVIETLRLRVDLAYDGTAFYGWASQRGLRTVQGELESALGILLRSDGVRLTVAGRTDAGVHAADQVAHVDVTQEQLDRWTGKTTAAASETERSRSRARKLNGVLRRAGAEDVTVWGVRQVPEAFDARFSALSRRYEYRLVSGQAHPLVRHFTVSVPHALSLECMQLASQQLLGLRDFTTFCKAREGATAVRYLKHFSWHTSETGVFIAQLEADAFCHSMVRALVGAAVAAGRGRIAAQEVLDLANARERTSRFAVMPAHGLTLVSVEYPSDDELSARVQQTRAKRDPLT
jgi:tRNA pseudouridine38-40 synthase